MPPTGTRASSFVMTSGGAAPAKPVLLASLRPNTGLVWQRVKTPDQPLDGPILYQIIFRSSATPGHIPRIANNFTLTNSLISDDGNQVAIGGLSISPSGAISFANGQTFPGTGTVNSITAGNSFITIGGSGANPTIALNTTSTDARYLQLGGGTMTGAITFANGQTFPGTGTVTSIATGAGLTGGPITGTGTVSIQNLGVTNAMLANPALTVNTGSGLTGGGIVALGGNTSLSLDTTFTNARYLQLGGGTLTGTLSGTTASFSGALSALSFSGDGSALNNVTAVTANNALALGGNPAGSYKTTAQNDLRYLQLSGGTLSGGLVLGATGTANAGAGANSNPQDWMASVFNSNTGTAQLQFFRWQAEPTGNNSANPAGSFNLLFSGTGNGFTPTETGLSIASNGRIAFAPGQTFPAAGLPAAGGDLSGTLSSATVVGLQGHAMANTAPTNGQVLQFDGANWVPATLPAGGTVTSVGSGLGLTGGPITNSGTLAIDTNVVPQLGAGNTFTALNSFTGGTQFPSLGTATPGGGFDSSTLDLTASTYSTLAGAAVNQRFRWQAEPVNNNSNNASGALNLLFSAGSNPMAETGLSIANNGQITFAGGQTFPGVVGSVTAGDSSIAIGGTASAPTVAVASGGITNAKLAADSVTNSNIADGSLNPAKVTGTAAILGANNFTGDQAVTGNVSLTGNLGVGTPTPGAKLDIAVNSGHIYAGDAGCSAGFTGLGFGSLLTGCGNYSLLGQGTDTMINRPTNGIIDFRENNVSQVSIPHGGGLQINTTSNFAALSVVGTGFWTGYFQNDSTNSTYAVQGYYSNNAQTGYGVFGWTAGKGGVGVYGLADNSSGSGTAGVYGADGSLNGTAGVFNNTAGGKVLSGLNNTTEVFSIDGGGNLFAAGTGANTIVLPNDATIGTFNNGLAKLTTDNPSKAKASIFGDKSGVIGAVVSGGGQSGSATIVVAGRARCVFENAAVAGDYVTIGRIFNAECFDAGALRPTGEQVVGRVLQSAACCATLPIVLFGPEDRLNAGTVTSVTPGDVSISIGGTAGAPTVAVAANGITNTKVADGTLSPAKITGTAAILGANNFTGNQTVTGNVTASGTVSGNGSGLTNLNASNLSSGTVPVSALSGTYNINISGNAATATNAQQLGGVVAANYARTDVGNNLTGVQNLGASAAIAISDTNEGTTGTTLNELAKLDFSGNAIMTAPGDTGGALGIVVAGSGTTGQAQIATSGVASCDFDNSSQHAGNYVTISPTVAGKCHDAGGAFPTGTQVIGRVVFTGGTTSNSVYLFGPEQRQPTAPVIVASANLQNLNSNPSLFSYTPAKDGLFRVAGYIVCTTATPSTKLAMEVDWTDVSGRLQFQFINTTGACSNGGNFSQATWVVQAKAGTPITLFCQTDVFPNGRFAAYAALEQLF